MRLTADDAQTFFERSLMLRLVRALHELTPQIALALLDAWPATAPDDSPCLP